MVVKHGLLENIILLEFPKMGSQKQPWLQMSNTMLQFWISLRAASMTAEASQRVLLRQLVIVKNGLVQSLETSGLEKGCAALGSVPVGSAVYQVKCCSFNVQKEYQ